MRKHIKTAVAVTAILVALNLVMWVAARQLAHPVTLPDLRAMIGF